MEKINNFWLVNQPKNQFLIWTLAFKDWTRKEVNFKLSNWFDFSDISIINLLKNQWIDISEVSFEDTSLIPSDREDNSYDLLSVTKNSVVNSVRNITLH